MRAAICHIPAPDPGPRPPVCDGVRSSRPRQMKASSDTTQAISRVVSLAPVTQVTQLSSHSLRARARRANPESNVTKKLSLLISDTSDTTLQLSAPLRAYAPTVRLNKTHVTHVTGGQP